MHDIKNKKKNTGKKNDNDRIKNQKQQKGHKKSVFPTLMRLASYARNHWLAIIGTVVTVLVSTGLELIPPWLIRYGIDNFIVGNKPKPLWISG